MVSFHESCLCRMAQAWAARLMRRAELHYAT